MTSFSIELLRRLDISFRKWGNYCSASVVALQQPINHNEIIAGAIHLQHNTCPFRIWVSIKSLFCIRLQSVTSLWIVEYQYTLIDYLRHIYIYLTAQKLYMNYCCYIIILCVKHFYTNVKCRLDIYHWGAGLAVTGRIRDNGQKPQNFLFKQEIGAAPVTSTFSSTPRSSRRPLLEI